MGSPFSKNIKKMQFDSTNLQEWMTFLPDDIRTKIPIIHLAIPGSHNSMTFKINRKSKIAPDADETLRRVHRLFPWCISRWAKTQKLSVTEQLNNGIRFFDLRISKWEMDPNLMNNPQTNIDIFYFVHGLYSGTVESAVIEFNTFLESHPGEVIILDFQHFYDMIFEDHYLLHNYLKCIFGDKIFACCDGNLSELTLERAYNYGKQVVIIYRNDFHEKEYWLGKFWPTPWPKTADLKTLKYFLNTSLQHRSKELGWVSQCILTPNAAYIAKSPFRSLEHTALQVIIYLESWIAEQQPGLCGNNGCCTKRANVFIADFVNLKQCAFIIAVINLNKKLLC